MENKLQQLTQKLYEEGLSKGRSEADRLVEQAKKEAARIVADANARAREIVQGAERQAEDLRKNTETEVALASRQMVAALKQRIQTLVMAKNITPAVREAVNDPAFVKDMIAAVVKNWDGGARADLNVMLPADTAAGFRKELQAAVGKALDEGFEITLDRNVKSGFRVGPKDGSYYISFTDADFDALFREYLRPKVSELLYGEPNDKR